VEAGPRLPAPPPGPPGPGWPGAATLVDFSLAGCVRYQARPPKPASASTATTLPMIDARRLMRGRSVGSGGVIDMEILIFYEVDG
jgi:hypothetical protein